MAAPADLEAVVVAAWQTNARITGFLIDGIPAALWSAELPETPQRTVRSIAAHLHNARCRWIRTLGAPHGITVPAEVDRRTVTRRGLHTALARSARRMGELLRFGCAHDGRIPPTPAYVWRNLALDVGHVLTYFVAHEAHHRGQIVMLARQTGHRLPAATVNGLWQWKPERPARGSRRGS